MLDATELIGIITTPATSHAFTSTPAPTEHGLGRYQFRWSWGSVTDPARRVVVTISTAEEPVPDDGKVTVYYTPTCMQITVGGEPVRDRYVGIGLYSFTYDEEKPEAPQDLGMVLNPLSSPVRTAPYRSPFF